MKQKRYNQEFKQTIVELYRSGTAVSDLSREYGGGLTPAEIAEIQKENLRLQQEVEILKKAMTIFAKK